MFQWNRRVHPKQKNPLSMGTFLRIFLVQKFRYLTPNEFQWGKSLGSPFNNPSCGRANGSLGVPEIAGVWLVLRGPAFDWKMFFFNVCQWSFFLKFLPRFQIACCENPMSIGLFFSKKNAIFHKFPSSILHFIYQCHNKGFFAGRLFSWHQRLSPEVFLQRWTLIAKAPASSMRCLSSDEKNGFRVAMTFNKKGSGSIGFDFVWKFNHHI